MFIFRVLNTVPYSNEAGAKDLVASLHSFFTSNMLVGLAVLVSWKQFGGKPIECMVPTDFTSAWAQYAENYCWAQDTYFIPFSEPTVEENGDSKSSEQVSYYQWMPFFLLFEAACFRLPCFIWKYFASQSGMRVGEILRIASDEHNAVPGVKKGNIDALCVHLQGALRFQKRLKKRNIVPHKILRFLNVKYSTHYVLLIYFLSKFAFLINVGLQAKLLNRYLFPKQDTTKPDDFGFAVWRSLWNGNQTWMDSGLFPRVTLCDFEDSLSFNQMKNTTQIYQVREMGNIQKHTVQCVLLINILTEKIFMILWAWYVVLGAFTVCNLFSWCFVMFSETSKEHFIINHLEMCEASFDKKDLKSREHVDRFVDKYLGMDGCLLLQLISQHADVVFTTELIGSLWNSYHNIEEQRRALKEMDKMLPLIRPEANLQCGSVPNNIADGKIAKRSSPNISPQKKLSRTGSFDGEIGRKTAFDDSDEDSPKPSKENSNHNSRRTSKAT